MEIDFFTITIGSNLTTLASSGLEIKCPAYGFPKPVIRWYRQGIPVEPGVTLKVDNDTGTLATLSIFHGKGGTFTCKATNVKGSVNASSVVTVLGNYGVSTLIFNFSRASSNSDVVIFSSQIYFHLILS